MKTYEFYIQQPELVKIKAENLEEAIKKVSRLVCDESSIIIDNKELVDEDGNELCFGDICPNEYHLY